VLWPGFPAWDKRYVNQKSGGGLKENIYLQDPELGAMRTIKRDDFLRVWFDFKKDYITSWKDMIIRQLIAVYPKKK